MYFKIEGAYAPMCLAEAYIQTGALPIFLYKSSCTKLNNEI
jgi:hypothetical protein